MTTEQLLQDRYLVIADFPLNDRYPIGKIITVLTEGQAQNDNGHPVFWCEFSEFQHLFRPMKWHERRTDEDLKCVKYVHVCGGVVANVLFFTTNTCGYKTQEGATAVHKNSVLPATESEYLQYINTKI